jgi:hypothetical protein
MHVVVVVSLLVAVALAVATRDRGTTQAALRLDVGELRSHAHEALELARTARDGRVNRIYVAAQAHQFAEAIDDLAASFAHSSQSPVAPDALARSRALAATVRELPDAVREPARLRPLHDQLQAHVTAIDALERRSVQ